MTRSRAIFFGLFPRPLTSRVSGEGSANLSYYALSKFARRVPRSHSSLECRGEEPVTRGKIFNFCRIHPHAGVCVAAKSVQTASPISELYARVRARTRGGGSRRRNLIFIQLSRWRRMARGDRETSLGRSERETVGGGCEPSKMAPVLPLALSLRGRWRADVWLIFGENYAEGSLSLLGARATFSGRRAGPPFCVRTVCASPRCLCSRFDLPTAITHA